MSINVYCDIFTTDNKPTGILTTTSSHYAIVTVLTIFLRQSRVSREQSYYARVHVLSSNT